MRSLTDFAARLAGIMPIKRRRLVLEGDLLRLKTPTFARASALARCCHRGRPRYGCDNPRRTESETCRVDRIGSRASDRRRQEYPDASSEPGEDRHFPAEAGRSSSERPYARRAFAASWPNSISEGLPRIRPDTGDQRAGIDQARQEGRGSCGTSQDLDRCEGAGPTYGASPTWRGA